MAKIAALVPKDTPIQAAMQADAMLERADLDGYAVWRRILRAAKELPARGPPPENTAFPGLSTLAGEHPARGVTRGVTAARSMTRHALRVAVLLLRRSVVVSALGEHEKICALSCAGGPAACRRTPEVRSRG